MSSSNREASYVALQRSGALEAKARDAWSLAERCRLCPRICGARRVEGQLGRCGGGLLARVAYHGLHFGEEPPINGRGGAGTVFFSGCSLRCSYCQNYQISHQNIGKDFDAGALAATFLELQDKGAHNIDLVTPTHYLPQILDALSRAAGLGLRIPLAYNTSGYETVETLRLLDGVVDIYLADMKYGRGEDAEKLSCAPDYVEVNQRAVLEMHRQVGALKLTEDGVAFRGILIRHLVLPQDLGGTREVLRFIAEKLDRHVPVSLMSQYRPAYRAGETPAMARRITPRQYAAALRLLNRMGLERAYVQRLSSVETGFPDFTRPDPFDWPSERPSGASE